MTTRTRRTSSVSSLSNANRSPRLAEVHLAPRADSAVLTPARLGSDALSVDDFTSATPLVAPGLNTGRLGHAAAPPATRDHALAAVAAWRRADDLREAATAIPSWAMAPLPTDWSPAHAAVWRARETAEADEAEERGLALAMGGLAAGAVVALLVGAPTSLGAVVGLVVGAAVGWRPPLPRVADCSATRSAWQRRSASTN